MQKHTPTQHTTPHLLRHTTKKKKKYLLPAKVIRQSWYWSGKASSLLSAPSMFAGTGNPHTRSLHRCASREWPFQEGSTSCSQALVLCLFSGAGVWVCVVCGVCMYIPVGAQHQQDDNTSGGYCLRIRNVSAFASATSFWTPPSSLPPALLLLGPHLADYHQIL